MKNTANVLSNARLSLHRIPTFDGSIYWVGEMPMQVWWSEHFVRLEGKQVKEVTCESCRAEFAYELQRTESGAGMTLYSLNVQGAEDRAAEQAAKNLQSSLNRAFEIVPCPNCGAYQQQMVTFLKNAHLMWLLLLAGGLIIGSIVSLVVAYVTADMSFLVIGCIAFPLGGVLILYRKWSKTRYDPNGGDPEPRIQLGRTRAVLRERRSS